MSDADAATTSASAQSTPKKSAKSKTTAAKKPRAKPSHPKTGDMVNSAIKNLKERGGSSLQAIKKYISANYKVDAEKLAPFIRKYLKNAVTTGSLVQTKGKGASGSFKLAGSTAEKKSTQSVSKPKTVKPKSPTKAKKPKTSPVKKPSTSKKVAPKKASVTPKKAPVKVKSSTPTKAKSAAKSPTKKPKAPKPKKTTKGKSPKKAPAKKK